MPRKEKPKPSMMFWRAIIEAAARRLVRKGNCTTPYLFTGRFNDGECQVVIGRDISWATQRVATLFCVIPSEW